MDIAPIDLENIQKFADRVIGLVGCRDSVQQYLKKGMTSVAPNLSALLGEQVGARLISHAGSLTKLAKCPASTIQILGAEKALFRYAAFTFVRLWFSSQILSFLGNFSGL